MSDDRVSIGILSPDEGQDRVCLRLAGDTDSFEMDFPPELARAYGTMLILAADAIDAEQEARKP